MKLSFRKQVVKYLAVSIFLGLLGSAILVPRACAQAEIDPDHFDLQGMEPVPQPTADRRVQGTQYDRAFSLPYSVQCEGKNLTPGKYSISLRSDGKATLRQKGHTIEIAGVVRKETSQRRDEVVVVENKKNGRTLAAVRVSGIDFVFDAKRWTDPLGERSIRRLKVPLTAMASK